MEECLESANREKYSEKFIVFWTADRENVSP